MKNEKYTYLYLILWFTALRCLFRILTFSEFGVVLSFSRMRSCVGGSQPKCQPRSPHACINGIFVLMCHVGGGEVYLLTLSWGRAAGMTHFRHSRSLSYDHYSGMTLASLLMPGRSTSGFHPPGRHCLHQARNVVRCSASCTKGEVQPSKNHS